MKKVCWSRDSLSDASMIKVTVMNKKNWVLVMSLYVASSISSSESNIPFVYVIIEPVPRALQMMSGLRFGLRDLSVVTELRYTVHFVKSSMTLYGASSGGGDDKRYCMRPGMAFAHIIIGDVVIVGDD